MRWIMELVDVGQSGGTILLEVRARDRVRCAEAAPRSVGILGPFTGSRQTILATGEVRPEEPANRSVEREWWRRRESNPRPKTGPQGDTTGVFGRLSLARPRSDRRDRRRASPSESRPQPPGEASDQP